MYTLSSDKQLALEQLLSFGPDFFYKQRQILHEYESVFHQKLPAYKLQWKNPHGKKTTTANKLICSYLKDALNTKKEEQSTILSSMTSLLLQADTETLSPTDIRYGFDAVYEKLQQIALHAPKSEKQSYQHNGFVLMDAEDYLRVFCENSYFTDTKTLPVFYDYDPATNNLHPFNVEKPSLRYNETPYYIKKEQVHTKKERILVYNSFLCDCYNTPYFIVHTY